MGEVKRPDQRPEEVIAAFDRERQETLELTRRHNEHVRKTREANARVEIERRRRPR